MATITKLLIALVTISAMLFGCTNVSKNPIGNISSTEGFVAFDTPRTSHNPGTVIRRSQDGQLHFVGVIPAAVYESDESFPEVSKSRIVAISAILKTIGAANDTLPASLNSNLNNSVEIFVSAFDGKRKMIDDTYFNALQAFFSDKPVLEQNTYYVIKETVASSEMNMMTKFSTNANINADAEFNEWVSVNGGTKLEGGNIVKFNKSFTQPHNILYKPERLCLTCDPVLARINMISIQ